MDKENREHRFHLDCDCGQCCLMIDDWAGDADRPEDSQTIMLYYMTTYPTTDSLWRRLKVCWHIFRGREYDLYDIVIRKSQLREFGEFINKCVAE